MQRFWLCSLEGANSNFKASKLHSSFIFFSPFCLCILSACPNPNHGGAFLEMLCSPTRASPSLGLLCPVTVLCWAQGTFPHPALALGHNAPAVLVLLDMIGLEKLCLNPFCLQAAGANWHHPPCAPAWEPCSSSILQHRMCGAGPAQVSTIPPCPGSQFKLPQ